MREKKKGSNKINNNLKDEILSTEDDITDQDNYDEDSDDYFISDGKKIQRLKKQIKREIEEKWD